MTRPSEAELIEALKPFAQENLSRAYASNVNGDASIVVCRNDAELTLGDFRRAREVYRALTRAEGGKREDAEAARLSGGLIAINQADPSVPAEVLRGIAYDIALNCIEPDVAEFQIARRAALTAPSQPASALDDEADMAAVGRALMATLDACQDHPLLKDWSPAECPSEVVTDLLDLYDDQRAAILASQPSTHEGKAEPVAWRGALKEAHVVMEWLREPDNAEDWSLSQTIDWLNRRPIAEMSDIR